MSKIFAEHYVLVELTIDEADDKKNLENPGAKKVEEEMGGAAAGLPYYFFLDKDGKKLADSLAMPGGANIGYPANDEEIKTFIALLEKTAPRLTEAQRGQIAAYLTAHIPKK